MESLSLANYRIAELGEQPKRAAEEVTHMMQVRSTGLFQAVHKSKKAPARIHLGY